MAITDWPADERPREKLLARGAAALSDALHLDDAGVPANMEAVPELMPAVRDAYATVVDAIAII